MPRRILVARAVLAMVAVAHGAAIVVLVSLQGVLAEQISAAQPAVASADVSKVVLLELIRAGSFHALLVVVCGVYAAKISSGSRRVFRIVIASQVLSVLFGVVTWAISPDLVRLLTPPFVLAAMAILLLLLGSASSRAFFTSPPRADAKATTSH